MSNRFEGRELEAMQARNATNLLEMLGVMSDPPKVQNIEKSSKSITEMASSLAINSGALNTVTSGFTTFIQDIVGSSTEAMSLGLSGLQDNIGQITEKISMALGNLLTFVSNAIDNFMAGLNAAIPSGSTPNLYDPSVNLPSPEEAIYSQIAITVFNPLLGLYNIIQFPFTGRLLF